MSATTSESFDADAASAAYRSALDVIGAVEPTVAAAIRQELTDQRESLKLARAEMQQQLTRTEHPARRSQIEQAIIEIDKRLVDVDAVKSAPKARLKR